MTQRRPWNHRQSASERGYGSAWQRLRKSILERDRYLCQMCADKGRVTVATQVDHVLAKAKGGTDEDGNLRAVCRQCHDDKSQIDAGRRSRPRIGIDGWPEE